MMFSFWELDMVLKLQRLYRALNAFVVHSHVMPIRHHGEASHTTGVYANCFDLRIAVEGVRPLLRRGDDTYHSKKSSVPQP